MAQVQWTLALPVLGRRHVVGDEHLPDCGCKLCAYDLVHAQAPSCTRCGLRGPHECVPDSVTVAGQRLDVEEF